MRTAAIVTLVIGAGYAAGAAADVLDDRWYVSPMYTYTDQNRQSHNGDGGTLAIGKPIGQHFNLEAAAFSQHFEARDGNDRPAYNELGVKLNTLFMPYRGAFQPYLNAGVGVVHNERLEPGGDDSTDPMAEIGAGVIIPVNDHGVGLRAEGMYRYIDFDHDPIVPGGKDIDGIDEKMVNVGLYIPLEKKREPSLAQPTQVSEREPAIYDSDGDGVHDKIDACPDTLAGVTVDRHGCALRAANPAPIAAAPIVPVSQPAYSYQEVPVVVQSAPETPVVVHSAPAPTHHVQTEYRHEFVEADSDADGVPDRLDACPDTRRGVPADDIGCEPAHYRYRR